MSSDSNNRLPGRPRHYEVGYGKPPKQHRFKKGQSGNPSGRSRELVLGNSLAQFIRTLGIYNSGGHPQTRLRNQMKRRSISVRDKSKDSPPRRPGRPYVVFPLPHDADDPNVPERTLMSDGTTPALRGKAFQLKKITHNSRTVVECPSQDPQQL